MNRDVRLETSCTTCHTNTECRHFEMYVFGSEGVWLCHDCEMKVYKFIEQLAHRWLNIKKDEVLAKRRNKST